MSLAFQSSATSTAETITLPSDVQAGDVMVLVQRAEYNGTLADVTPTGWTDVGAAVHLVREGFGAADIRVSHKYKIAESGDASATVTGMNGANGNWKTVLVFRPDNPADSVAPQDLAGEIKDGDPAAQTCNASAGTEPLVVIASFQSRNSGPATASFSPAEDAFVANDQIDFYYKIYNASAADVTVDMDDDGNRNVLASFYLEVTEGSGGDTVAVGQASETDTANPITDLQTVSVGLANETDTATPIGYNVIIPIGQAIEADTANPVGINIGVNVNQAIETDTANPIYDLQTVVCGQAIENDTANSITVIAADVVQVGQALETDTANPITDLQTVHIGLAQEIDTAWPLFPVMKPTNIFYIARDPTGRRTPVGFRGNLFDTEER